MNKTPNSKIIKKLEKAEQVAISMSSNAKRNNEFSKWVRWELRKEYLKQEKDQFTRLFYGSDIPKRAFISYTKGKGAQYSSHLTSKLIELEGFTVTDGFKEDSDDGGLVLKRVLQQLKSASIHIGIYTKEYEIIIDGKKYWTPSVWTIEEKGMALGLGMPVLLILEKGIHDSFFSNTTGAFAHYIVDNLHQFKHELIDNAIREINKKYYDLVKKKNQEEGDIFDF